MKLIEVAARSATFLYFSNSWFTINVGTPESINYFQEVILLTCKLFKSN